MRLTEIQMKENKPSMVPARDTVKTEGFGNESVLQSILSSESMVYREKEEKGDFFSNMGRKGNFKTGTLHNFELTKENNLTFD